ncbi:MAG: hypothetical protein LBT27_08180 [Prevotellaceae bacterium]|nr:hypothetical protein [Prevotellaceae bacterium]
MLDNGIANYNAGKYTEAKTYFNKGLAQKCDKADFQDWIDKCNAKIDTELVTKWQRLQTEIANLQPEKQHLLSEIEELKRNNNLMLMMQGEEEQENSTLKEKLSEIAQLFPVIIKSVKVGNVDGNGTVITPFGNTLYSSSIKWLLLQIEYRGLQQYGKTVKLNIKLFKDNELKATMIDANTKFYDTGVVKLTTIYGSETNGFLQAGNYRYEIWYNDVCLKALDFKLY